MSSLEKRKPESKDTQKVQKTETDSKLWTAWMERGVRSHERLVEAAFAALCVAGVLFVASEYVGHQGTVTLPTDTNLVEMARTAGEQSIRSPLLERRAREIEQIYEDSQTRTRVMMDFTRTYYEAVEILAAAGMPNPDQRLLGATVDALELGLPEDQLMRIVNEMPRDQRARAIELARHLVQTQPVDRSTIADRIWRQMQAVDHR